MLKTRKLCTDSFLTTNHSYFCIPVRALEGLMSLIKDDGSLDGGLILHRLETLSPLLKLVRLVDDTLNLDLSRILS